MVRRPPRERKTPGSNPACSGIFSGSIHTSDLKIGTPVATLPGVWRYRRKDLASVTQSGDVLVLPSVFMLPFCRPHVHHNQSCQSSGAHLPSHTFRNMVMTRLMPVSSLAAMAPVLIPSAPARLPLGSTLKLSQILPPGHWALCDPGIQS